jgi:pyruvate formate lyase activating enzyme
MTETFSAMGIDQAIETCGFFEWQDVEDILRQMDTIFVDIKTMDPHRHRQLTGRDNRQILNNIKRMGVLNKHLIIRIPLIPGVNDSAENLKETADFVRSETPGARVEILPYHALGLEKYDRLNLKEYKHRYRVPEPEEMDRACAVIRKSGVPMVSFK